MTAAGLASAEVLASDLVAVVPRLVLDWDQRTGGRRHQTVEGSMLSADISGFTRLSERLASLGKRGAEELITVINSCFDAMIDVAADYGGDVLKFGGDALLLLFTGPHHTARACRAAVGMRATIDAPIDTATAGRVQLRMSQGMHSGTFTFFLVDGGCRDLVVTGPGVTTTVRCEAAADAGQILLSPAAAAAVDRSWLGAARPDGRLLRRTLPAADDIRYLDLSDGSAVVDAAQFVPAAQLAHLATREGEHRPVGITFIQFSGTDAALAAGDVDGVASRLQELADAAWDACARFGVHWLATDVYADGGKVILTAGAPVTLGDDDDAIVRAARYVVDNGPDLQLCAGVNSGRLFAGWLGSRRRRTYTTMGDGTNLAARLMQRAEPGEVVATTSLLARANPGYDIAPLESFFVKGKTVAIEAALVRRAPQHAITGDDVRLPLVGRDVELTVLEDALARASRREATGIDLVGPDGVGKTRLLDELCARHPDVPRLTAVCGRYARETPYFAARSLLRSLARIDPTATPDGAGVALRAWIRSVAPHIEPLLPLVAIPFDAAVPDTPEASEVAPAFRRRRAHELVLELLDIALDAHGIFVVDEAQWLDEASATLLGAVTAEAGGRGWLVCLARTPGPSPLPAPSDLTVVELGPLDAESSLTLARSAASAHVALGQRDVGAIAARAGGHPLFTIQLVAAVAAAGRADALPESVEKAVTARLDVLGASERALLRHAAVMGARVDLEVLAEATEDRAVRDPATWGPLADFVEVGADGTVRFRHTLYQQVAYEGLPFRRRAAMHLAVGHALERSTRFRADDEAELLSLHFHHADDHERAWRYSVVAGDDARSKYANVEAREFYDRALSHAAGAATAAAVAEVREALGDVCELDGLYERADAAYRGARTAGDDTATRARLLRKQGVLRERRGTYSDALRWYGRALALVGDSDTAGAVELSIAYAGVRSRQGRYRDAARWARRAEAVAAGTGLADADAHASYLIGLSAIPMRDPDAAHWLERAVAIYQSTGDAVGLGGALNNLGMDAYYAGRWEQALAHYEASRRARERAGDVVGAAMSANNGGEILSDPGHHAAAASQLADALHEWRRANYAVGVALATANLGRLAARTGDVDGARALLDDALARFETLDARGFVADAHLRRAEAMLLAGADADALATLEAIEDDDAVGAEPALLAASLRLHGVALRRRGDADRARALLDASVDVAERAGLRFELAQTLTALGATGDAHAVKRAAALLTDLGVVRAVVP